MNNDLILIKGSDKSVNYNLPKIEKIEDQYKFIFEMLKSIYYESYLDKKTTITSQLWAVAQEKCRKLFADLYMYSGLQCASKSDLLIMSATQVQEIFSSTTMFYYHGLLFNNGGQQVQTAADVPEQWIVNTKGQCGFNPQFNDFTKEIIKTVNDSKSVNEINQLFRSTNSSYVFTNFSKFVTSFSLNVDKTEKCSFSKILINILLYWYGEYSYEGGINTCYGGHTCMYQAEIVGVYFPYTAAQANPNLNFRACTLGDLVNYGVPGGYEIVPIRTEDCQSAIVNNDWIIAFAEQPFKEFSRGIALDNDVQQIFRSFSNCTRANGGNVDKGFCFVIVDNDIKDDDVNIVIGAATNVNTVVNSPFIGGVDAVATCDDIYFGSSDNGEAVFNRWCKYYYNPIDIEIAVERVAILAHKFPLFQCSRYMGFSNLGDNVKIMGLRDEDRGSRTMVWGLANEINYTNGNLLILNYIKNAGTFVDYQGVRTCLLGIQNCKVSYHVPDATNQMWIAGARHMFSNVGILNNEKAVCSGFYLFYRSAVFAQKGAWIFDHFRSITHKPLNVEILQPLVIGISHSDYIDMRPECSQTIDYYFNKVIGVDGYTSRCDLSSFRTYNVMDLVDVNLNNFLSNPYFETGGIVNFAIFYKGMDWLQKGYKLNEKLLYTYRDINLGELKSEFKVDEKFEYVYQTNEINENIDVRNTVNQLFNGNTDTVTVTDQFGNQNILPGMVFGFNLNNQGFFRNASNMNIMFSVSKMKITMFRCISVKNFNFYISWARVQVGFQGYMAKVNGTNSLYVLDTNIGGKNFETINEGYNNKKTFNLEGFSIGQSDKK